MPKDEFTLPTAETIDRIYGVEHPNGGSRYLNGVRMGIVQEGSNIAAAYHNEKERYANLLAFEVVKNVTATDVAVKPPSSRDDADIYLDAVVRETKRVGSKGSPEGANSKPVMFRPPSII